ncbi:MAG: hypothetical protein VB070_04505 [Clostridiaceae bacterium]|nr:hypothetical protein [Clostridiaceae bacterium]
MPNQTEPKRVLSLPNQLFCVLICLILSWLAALSFFTKPELRLVMIIPGFILLIHAILQWQRKRQILTSREQLKWFLELLLSRLSAGATLEHSFCDTVPGLSQLLGNKSPFLQSLRQVNRQLAAHQPLETLLPQLSRQLHCPEAQTFFYALPELRKMGGQVILYVRQHLQMVTEQLSLQQDLNAETTQRQTEAYVLAIMPFLLAILLRQSADEASVAALSQPAGIIGMVAAFLMALFAAALTLSSTGFDTRDKKKLYCLPVYRGRVKNYTTHICHLFHHIYRDILPESYGSRILQILINTSHPESNSDRTTLTDFFMHKAVLLTASLIPGLVILLIDPIGVIWLLILPLIVTLLHDQQIFMFQRQKITEYRLEYPIFLNLTVALLQTGLSLHKTLLICTKMISESSQLNSRKATAGNALQQDLSRTSRLLRTGRPIEQVLDLLSKNCPLPEAQAALLLMSRYDHSGGMENLQLLSLQTSACWSVYRNTLRKQLERQSLRLLVPMTLDLLAVLVTTLLPAVLSLRTISFISST